MVWRDVSIVDQRQDFVMLASCEGANVAELCRRFDISRQTGYLWLRRFFRSGGAGRPVPAALHKSAPFAP